jgi:ABC-2 type transport system ATP-binding protein
MRDGDLLADDSVRGVLEVTGADDVETAFLRLIDRGTPDLRPVDESEASR